MKKVIQFRAGAPDKFMKFTSGDYELIQRDGVNLRDYSVQEVSSVDDDTWFLSADEGDIEFAMNLPADVQKRVMLPQTADGIINFKKFVPKDSEFYQNLSKRTLFSYPIREIIKAEQFPLLYDMMKDSDRYVIKVAQGSGSRGVIVVNSDRVPQPGAREQYQLLIKDKVDEVIELATKRCCNIVIQDLAYTDLVNQEKYDLSIIIRHGKLVAYHWSHPDNDSTNWDHGEFIRSEFTDKAVNSLVNYLKDCNITDGFFNLDGYTNYKDFLTLIEINWRLANCVFIFEAWGLDYIDMYLNPDKDNWNSKIPYGKYPYLRYWRCSLYNLQKGGKL